MTLAEVDEDPAPSCAALPAGIAVLGGRGGTAARIEDLHRAALELRRAADLLDDATATLATAERVTWAGADPLVSGQHARTALAPLRRGPATPAATAARVRELAQSLDRAAETYAAAERSALGTVRGLGAWGATLFAETPLRFLTGQVVVAGLTATLLLEGAVHRSTGRWVAPDDLVRTGAAETLLHGVATYLRALRPGIQLPVRHPVGDAVAPLAWRLGTGRVRVTPVVPVLAPVTQRLGVASTHPTLLVPPPPAPLPAPRTTADVLAAVDAGYEGGPGTVAVTRLDHPDGTRSWIVAVPGTEEFGVGTPNPFDTPSNLRLMAAGTEASVAVAASAGLVAGALAQAGVRRGEPVMLAGHSQGGMAAMRVAGDPAMRERYTITHVLTAGSPVAPMPVPRDVRVLSLEHTTDLVPITDAVPAPDGPNRTTVRIELADSPEVEDRLAARGVVDAHGSDVYVRSAARIAASVRGDPSLQDWDESALAQVYGAEQTTATTTEYAGVNVRAGDDAAGDGGTPGRRSGAGGGPGGGVVLGPPAPAGPALAAPAADAGAGVPAGPAPAARASLACAVRGSCPGGGPCPTVALCSGVAAPGGR